MIENLAIMAVETLLFLILLIYAVSGNMGSLRSRTLDSPNKSYKNSSTPGVIHQVWNHDNHAIDLRQYLVTKGLFNDSTSLGSEVEADSPTDSILHHKKDILEAKVNQAPDLREYLITRGILNYSKPEVEGDVFYDFLLSDDKRENENNVDKGRNNVDSCNSHTIGNGLRKAKGTKQYITKCKNATGPCAVPTSPFSSLVLVQFDGNPDSILPTDVIFLEDMFQKTYNELIVSICDEEDRLVVKAAALSNGGSSLIRNGGLSYSIKFSVDLLCRGCDTTTATIFSAPIKRKRRRRRDCTGKKSDSPECRKYMKRKGKYRKFRGSHSNRFLSLDEPLRSRRSKKDLEGKGGKKGSNKRKPKRFCNCDSTNPKFRPPTEREFQRAFNREIRGLKSQRYLQTRKYRVSDVTEIQAQSCASQISEFVTAVAVEMVGISPPSLGDADFLEKGFLETYNGMSEVQCDPFFRRIRAVFLLLDSALQSGINRYSIRFLVSGLCRGCTKDSNLFQVSSSRSSRNRHLQAVNAVRSSCTCPIFRPPNEAPTEYEFLARFSTTIRDLQQLGQLSSINGVASLQEVEEVECAGQTRLVSTIVVVDHMMTTTFSDQDLESIQTAFSIAYNRANSLNSEACDPLFRVIKSVVAILDGPSNLDRPLPEGQRRLTYVIDFQCQACSEDTALFDVSSSDGRSLQNLQLGDPRCFCPTEFTTERAPLPSEFLRIYGQIIGDLRNAGSITTVSSPVNILEVDGKVCDGSFVNLASTVKVDFVADRNLISSNDFGILEQVFRDTYNDLVESLCDPFFRNVLQVTIESGSPSVSTLTSLVQFSFKINLRCRGCDSSTLIFDVSPRLFKGRRNLQESNLCFCQIGNPVARAVARAEFESEFNSRVASLSQAGLLIGITAVENVVENKAPALTPRPVLPSSPPPTPIPILPSSPPPTPLNPTAPSSPIAPASPAFSESPVTLAPATLNPSPTKSPVVSPSTTAPSITSNPIQNIPTSSPEPLISTAPITNAPNGASQIPVTTFPFSTSPNDSGGSKAPTSLSPSTALPSKLATTTLPSATSPSISIPSSSSTSAPTSNAPVAISSTINPSSTNGTTFQPSFVNNLTSTPSFNSTTAPFSAPPVAVSSTISPSGVNGSTLQPSNSFNTTLNTTLAPTSIAPAAISSTISPSNNNVTTTQPSANFRESSNTTIAPLSVSPVAISSTILPTSFNDTTFQPSATVNSTANVTLAPFSSAPFAFSSTISPSSINGTTSQPSATSRTPLNATTSPASLAPAASSSAIPTSDNNGTISQPTAISNSTSNFTVSPTSAVPVFAPSTFSPSQNNETAFQPSSFSNSTSNTTGPSISPSPATISPTLLLPSSNTTIA